MVIIKTKKMRNNKVTIITGAASGLGLALAGLLIERGECIAIFDLDKKRMEDVVNRLGENAVFFEVDVTNPAMVQNAVKAVISKWGKIDSLVNAAGITGITNVKSHEVDLADFKRVFDINVNGCLITVQAVIPYMLEKKYGRILHIASIAGKEGNAGMVAYSSSKAAVIGMAKSQGKEYAETGLTINALAPAVIKTDLVAAMPAEQVKYMTDKIPMKKCGTLQEFAEMAAFIISPQNSFTTGFTFDLSGGRATY